MADVLDRHVADPDSAMRGMASGLMGALQRLETPRSIAELRLTDNDFETLRNWASSVTPSTAERWLRFTNDDGHPRAAILGLVATSFIAELARRETWDGSLWPAVRREFRTDTAEHLFTQGQPSQYFKDALRMATDRFGLRNVFGLEGTQAWYLSSYLQFGITRRSITYHLPRRLSGYEPLPRAVELLLHDADLRAESFFALWNSLYSYRVGNLAEDALRQQLKISPWVLPAWSDELVKAARAFMHLQGPRASWTQSTEADEDNRSFELLSRPSLVWNGSTASLRTEVVGLADLDLDLGAYTMIIGSDRYPFVNTADGPQGLAPITLPIDAPAVTATLTKQNSTTGEHELIVQSECVAWNLNDEVALFDAEGRPLDAWSEKMDRRRDYSLLLAPELRLQARPALSQRTPSGVTAAHIAAPWDMPLTVTLNDELIWDAEEAEGRLAPPFERAVIASIPGAWDGVEIGADLRVEVRHIPEDANVTSLLVGGASVQVNPPRDGVIRTPRMSLDPNKAGRRVPVVLRGNWHNRPFVVRKSVPRPWSGCQVLTNGGWTSMKGDSVLSRDVEGRPLRVFIPPAVKPPADRRPTVFDGDRVLGVVVRHGRTIRGVAGYGESLTIRSDRFNAPDEIFRIADVVSDGGVVKRLDSTDPELARLELVPDSHVDDRWESTTVDGRGRLMPAERELSAPSEMSVLGSGDTVGWLITVGKSIVGSGWRRPPTPDDLTPDEARDAALLMRAGKAPILRADFRKRVTGLIERHPWPVLEAWTLPMTSPFGELLVLDEPWAAVGREALMNWRHGGKDGVDAWIQSMLARYGERETLLRVASMGCDFPLPFGQIVVCLDEATQTQLRSIILGGEPADRLAQRVANRLGVDPGFVDGMRRAAHQSIATQGGLPEPARANIAIASSTEPEFRRWLAGTLMSGGSL